MQYNTRGLIHDTVRQLLSLPYLPDSEIASAFRRTWRHNSDQCLEPLFEYVERQWIAGEQWPPSAWTVYRATVRTNNDVEGWHRRLNNKATRGQLQLYVLIPMLFKEASLLPLQVKLVNEKKLQRRMYVYHMPIITMLLDFD